MNMKRLRPPALSRSASCADGGRRAGALSLATLALTVSLTISLTMTLAGCAVGPDYRRPDVDVPKAWRTDAPAMAEVINTPWWEQFDDAVLNELIDTALRENRDVRIAAARVDQFAAALQVTRSQFYPQVGYGVDATRARASRIGQPPLPPGADPYFSLYQGALSASWQIDLFGRVRRLSEASQAQVYASEQARRGVVLSLVASVASTYIALRASDQQVAIARSTAANFGETLRIFDVRFKAGAVSMTEVSQVRSQFEQAQASIPLLEQQVAAQENLLALLLGRHPGPIVRGRALAEFKAPAVPAELPSSLLLRRPDILQAEQQLVAANANIGAAKALYYPTLNLTGLLGSVSTAFGDWLSGPASAWSVAAGVSGPIFTGGAIAGQVSGAQAGERAALAAYQQTILNALRETNDALVGAQKRQEEALAQARRVEALTEFARLSRLRFEQGVASYLDVLIAENELFASQLTLVQTTSQRYTQLVAVYRAMGGGWVDIASQRAPQPLAGSPR
jgi:multidrug efflux system outer membrane protein